MTFADWITALRFTLPKIENPAEKKDSGLPSFLNSIQFTPHPNGTAVSLALDLGLDQPWLVLASS